MFFAAALCCIVSAVMVSCGKDNPDTPEPEPTPDPEPEVPVTPKDTVVYAVGQEAVPGKGYYYATIWKDGKRILLSDGSYDAFIITKTKCYEIQNEMRLGSQVIYQNEM